MPFDNTREVEDTPVIKLIRSGIERVKDKEGWTQKFLITRRGDGKFAVCMLGAIMTNEDGMQRHCDPRANLACEYMQQGLTDFLSRNVKYQPIQGYIGAWSVPSFNDHFNTTHEVMLKAFNHILGYAMAREFMKQNMPAKV